MCRASVRSWPVMLLFETRSELKYTKVRNLAEIELLLLHFTVKIHVPS